jgi:hypothetical protein
VCPQPQTYDGQAYPESWGIVLGSGGAGDISRGDQYVINNTLYNCNQAIWSNYDYSQPTDNRVIANNTVILNQPGSSYSGQIIVQGNSTVIENNTIVGNSGTQQGIYVVHYQGGDTLGLGNRAITNVSVLNNFVQGAHNNIYVQGASKYGVSDTDISGNIVESTGTGDPQSISLMYASDDVVNNNIIKNFQTSGGMEGIEASSDSNDIINNNFLVYPNTFGIDLSGGSVFNLTNNILGNPTSGTITSSASSVSQSNNLDVDLGQILSIVTPPVPSITGLSPNQGLLTGGTTVSITGTGFTGVTAVTFGSTAATNLKFINTTSLSATAPAVSTAGTVDITVTTPNGTSAISSTDQFIYLTGVSAPTVTGVSPNRGLLAGGTTVTITGTGFIGVTAVTFGNTSATNLQFINTTSLSVTAPAVSTTGTVDIRVTTPSVISTTSSADQFMYVTGVSAPIITKVTPNQGLTAGGTFVTITGSGFTGATNVTFGRTHATAYIVNSATSITVTSPAGTAGVFDVTVTTPRGTSATSSADKFTYIYQTPQHRHQTTLSKGHLEYDQNNQSFTAGYDTSG